MLPSPLASSPVAEGFVVSKIDGSSVILPRQSCFSGSFSKVKTSTRVGMREYAALNFLMVRTAPRS